MEALPSIAKHMILQVDDDDAAAYLFGVAVEESGCPATVHRVRDGQEALQFLKREGPHQGALIPDLIVLDLSMPMMDGWEFLDCLRKRKDLQTIPVLLSSPSAAGIIARRLWNWARRP